ncbi:MAG: PAS domain S-box protein, partial [Thermodesulfovibrionales bacterium]|nr:PAS domain S-box protein [Thermodesulfovibrionales bacterium]
MPLSYAMILIVRFSARTHLEKEVLETEVGERIRVEEGLQHSIRQLQLVTDKVSDVFWTMDRSGALIYVSPSVQRMFGYTPEEADGKTLGELLRPESLEIALRAFKERLRREETGDPDNSEHRYELMARRKDGSTFWAEVTSSPMRDSEGRLTGFLGITRNIHERKLAEEQLKNSEEQLRASLGQKNILLHEVHHRVKNNLAIISALLSLQVRQTGDQKLKELCTESQSRIHAMAYVHEQLYMQDDMETVNFESYAEGLAYYLRHTYRLSENDVSLSTDIESITLGLNILIPCGLILNELITNSLKHALTDTGGLRISIALHQSGDGLVNLIMGDNGPGLPEGLDPFSENKGLGMNIVNQLVGQ